MGYLKYTANRNQISRLSRMLFIALVSLSIFILGCTRDEGGKDDKSRVQIALPLNVEGMRAKSSTFSLSATSKLVHVSISVTGEAMPPLLSEWDYCRSCLQAPAPPSEFPLDVLSGKNRLFQVLAVYEDSASREMSIYYGDSTLDLNGGEVALPISMAKISAGTLVQGRVAGRYLTSATNGPTGVVSVRYYPTNGKPPMLVTREEMVGGFFNFFMLSGATLEYSVNGQVLWGGPVSLDSTVFATSDRIMKAYVPVHIRSRFENNSTIYYQQESRILVWGFWGDPGLDLIAKKVCAAGLGGTSLVLRRYSNTNLASTPSLGLVYTPQSSNPVPPSTASLVNTSSPLSSISIHGGASAGSLCYSYTLPNLAEEFKSFTMVRKSWIDAEDQENFSGFQKFLQFLNNTSLVGVGDYTASSVNYKSIIIRFLPELLNVVPKVRVYKSTTLNSSNSNIDRPFCPAIALGENGFVPASAILNYPGSWVPSFTINTQLTQVEAAQGASLVLCGLDISGNPLPLSGVFLPSWIFGGGAAGSMMADQVILEGTNNVLAGNFALLGQCSPILVKGFRGGVPAPFPSGSNIGLPSPPANTSFYPTYADCFYNTNALSGTFPLIRGGSEDGFYIKNTSGTDVMNLNVNFTRNIAGTSFPQSVSFNFLTDTSLSSQANKIKIRYPTSIFAHGCYPMVFWSWVEGIYSGLPRNAPKAISASVDLATPADLFYYTDPSCTNGMGVISGFDTSGKGLVYFKYKGTATSINLTPTIATPAGATLTGILTSVVTVGHPQAPARFSIELPSNLSPGCYGFRVASQDAFGRLTPIVGSAESVNLSQTNAAAGEGFSSVSDCSSTSATFSSSVPADGTHTNIIYYNVLQTGTSRTIQATSSGGLNITGSILVTTP